MTTNNPKPSLHRKIAEIVTAVDHVEKDGYNKSQNYAFTSEAAFLRALRGEMATRQLTMFPSVEPGTFNMAPRSDGGKGFVTSCVVNYTITDAESGEQIIASVPTQGFDSLDKGAFKAMTGALKYVLRQTFMLPTGDDPEASDSPVGGQSAKRGTNGSGVTAVELSEGVYPNGTIAESKVVKKGSKKLWLVVGHVAGNKPGMIGEAKSWLDLNSADQFDAIESQAVELGIVAPGDNRNPAAEVESFDHATLAGNAVTVVVEMHGDNRSVSIGAPEAVTA